MEDILYTRSDLVDAGVSETSIKRWTQKLMDTDMIVYTERGIRYTEPCKLFLCSRINKQGPSTLPEAGRIASLWQSWVAHGTVEGVAEELDESIVSIQISLAAVGVPVRGGL